MGCDYYESTVLEIKYSFAGKIKIISLSLGKERCWISADSEENYRQKLEEKLEEDVPSEISNKEKESLFNDHKYQIINLIQDIDLKMDDIDYGEISYSDEDIDKFVLMSKCLSEIFITKEKYITRINLINRNKRIQINFDSLFELIEIKKIVSRWERT